MIQKLQRWITIGVLSLAAGVLLAVVITVFLQVVFRYVLARPLAWSVELARFLFTWASMLGAAGGAVGILNQSIDLLTEKLPDRAQRAIDVLGRGVTLLTAGLLLVTSWELTGRVYRQTSSALGIRMSYVYAAVPVGLILLMIVLGLDTYNTYRKGAVSGAAESEAAGIAIEK